jgi:predicted Fe-Mo cluster-binding NifX family protein
MTLAIPIWEGRISPVLDVAGRFLVIQFVKGREVGRREFLVGQTQPASLIKGIKEMGVGVLVCGAVSQPIADGLARSGVRVLPHICGEIETVVQAFLMHTLDRPEFRMPGCFQHLCGCHQNRRRRRGYSIHQQTNQRI